MAKEVKFTKRSSNNDIAAIGGYEPSRWEHTEQQAINNIESRTESYYVYKNGYNVNVIVASHNGRKYIKTENDGITPDNLLSLPIER